MKTSTLLEQLKAAITAEEYENLTNNTITHISQYNRRTTLEIIGLHPQEAVHYTTIQKDNTTLYFCPMREDGEGSVCHFCVCRKARET